MVTTLSINRFYSCIPFRFITFQLARLRYPRPSRATILATLSNQFPRDPSSRLFYGIPRLKSGSTLEEDSSVPCRDFRRCYLQ